MLESFLESSALNWPEKIALVTQDRRFTYREIDELSNRQAHALLAAGVKPQDRVAIFLENSVEAVCGIFGALKAGAVFVLINPATRREKLASLLQDFKPRVIVTDPQRTRLCPSTPQAPVHALLHETPPPKSHVAADLAALLYTSGSTGQPKAVMLTHVNIQAAADSIAEYLECNPIDIVLNALPLSFSYGLYQLLVTFKTGGTLILERSFAYPAALLDTMAKENVTGLPLVPTIAAILLRMDLARWKLPALRYITNAASALTASHITGLSQGFPGVRIYPMYGQTECARIAYLPPDQVHIRPTSVGRAIPHTDAYVIEESGNRAGNGTIGELVVSGAHVMQGYWNRPTESDKVLTPGPTPHERVLHTGDLFRTDDEGYLYFIARKDDIIKSGGEKVSPAEIESVLCALPQIFEAAVIGLPDPVLGQSICAFVVLNQDAVITPRDILRACSQHLEQLLIPKTIRILSALPKTPNGKIDKLSLANQL